MSLPDPAPNNRLQPTASQRPLVPRFRFWQRLRNSVRLLFRSIFQGQGSMSTSPSSTTCKTTRLP